MKLNSVFTQCFFFLRQHDAGVENIADMKAAGFSGVFCNIGDPASPPEAWSVIRQRCANEGMFCGPWARTGLDSFEIERLNLIIQTADAWHSPLIVNSESEIKASGSVFTSLIRRAIGDRDGAISTLDRPMASVQWTEVADIPILPQLFPDGGRFHISEVKQEWHDYGVQCVFPTYASYGGRKPSDYILKAPYSIYTADDCGLNYDAWKPTSSGYIGCVQIEPEPEPEPEVKVAGVKTETDKAWDHFEEAKFLNQWYEDNPGEYTKIKNYKNAEPGTPAPLGIRSDFGKGLLALVEAGKYADGTHS